MIRVDGATAAHLLFQEEEGGSIPTSTLLRKGDWEVRPCSFGLGRCLVREYHYAGGGSNTATFMHGMFRRGLLTQSQCHGIAWWIPPTKSAANAAYSGNWQGVLSLSRLVAVPGAPKNTCSFLIRHSMRLIDRQRWPCFLSYADEWQEHTGAIYLAAGWTFAGYTAPERCYVKAGKMIARKAGPKTRTHAEMLAMGCECIGKFRKKRFIHIER